MEPSEIPQLYHIFQDGPTHFLLSGYWKEVDEKHSRLKKTQLDFGTGLESGMIFLGRNRRFGAYIRIV